ncbi:MAG: amidohydrolase family protein [Actinomycetota bacterium]|nr:amidohydrolase family protein [Actinomycetota bacterium]
MTDHDLVLRGGTVIDGTGADGRTADVAVDDGIVTEVGRIDGRGRQEIDADGALVTPGFVDIHTHYDGQAVWDERLAPSSWHGVTTVVMSNCGVGFAPVRAHDRQRLVELMEGVEDIPGTAIHEGLHWGWESFAEYLDALDGRPHDIDFAAQLPHAALRLFVMGDRCAADQEATADDIAEMARLAAEAIEAGALGFTTSRTRNHRASTGEHTPTLRAARAELVGIAEAIGSTGTGVLQVVSDFLDLDDEVGTVRAMAEVSGRPLSISLLQNPFFPTQWRSLLEALEAGRADGLALTGQVAPRPVGILLGLQATLHPFLGNPAFMEVAELPFDEKLAALRDPERRRRVLDEAAARAATLPFESMFELGDPPDYEPQPEHSVAAAAARLGIDAAEHAYDLMLGDDGRALLYVPFLNYADGNLDPQREMLAHPWTVPGLGDGGAHVGTICDGSFPTTLLTLWGRDRERGRFELPFLVQRHTSGTARTVGLLDRGVLAPGYRADLNVIDLDGLRLRPPEIHHDLPAGGRRLLQRAEGYRHTIVAGVETYRDGQPTDERALPGRLVRGARPAPV